MKSDGNIICSALMGNNKGLSSNDLFGQKLLSSRANGVGHANGNTDSAGEGHKLENVDSGNRLLPPFHSMDDRLAPRAARIVRI